MPTSDCYADFLAQKSYDDVPTGLAEDVPLHPRLFEFQTDIVRWALRRGRAAIWADTGLGKTLMQLEWARHVGRVLILCPLAVARQTIREAQTIGLSVTYAKCQAEAGDDITITNYERLDAFDPSCFDGVVLDESSILKSYDGKVRTAIIDAFRTCPFRLACTATPAPNDHMELGNHSEFLGVMTRVEMLSTFFVHDGGETQKWRLKGHARQDFWRWVSSWAIALRHPRDLGYEQDGYDLPPLRVHEHTVRVDIDRAAPGELFAAEARTLEEQRRERRATVADRVAVAARLANDTAEPWVVWCDLNDESRALVDAIDGAVEVTGSDAPEDKERALQDFADGRIRVLVTKPQIAGFGMNWQHCRNMAFVGVSHSFERYYQAVRRCWRFGQTRPVGVHVVTASTEGRVVESLRRKQEDANTMMQEMMRSMHRPSDTKTETTSRETEVVRGDGWTMHLGDCVDVVRGLYAGSIDYSIFSPPFASLYTYSASDRDMGNCRTHDEFFEHLAFLVPELLRVTKPGRLCSFHCMNLPTSKARDGVIGLTDFRGRLIDLFVARGWVFHSEVVIWKDPVTAMQRTKALGLLWKQLKKDSCMSRMGIPDYLVTMRAPGVNGHPVTHTAGDFPVEKWQRFASPVWADINPSDTLQHRSAREHEDERHICPLQLQVIDRALELWTNEGDTVLSPFAGIGSEGWCSLRAGRRFVGVELKRSYFDQACSNLREATGSAQGELWSAV